MLSLSSYFSNNFYKIIWTNFEFCFSGSQFDWLFCFCARVYVVFTKNDCIEMDYNPRMQCIWAQGKHALQPRKCLREQRILTAKQHLDNYWESDAGDWGQREHQIEVSNEKQRRVYPIGPISWQLSLGNRYPTKSP